MFRFGKQNDRNDGLGNPNHPLPVTPNTLEEPTHSDVVGLDARTSIPDLDAQPATFTLSLAYGSASKRGPRRKNDDYCAADRSGNFFAISDGIGGAEYGDVISKLAVNHAIEEYERTASIDNAFVATNTFASEVSRHLGCGSGATLLLAEFDRSESRFRFLSVGDTLAYRLRDGELEMLLGGSGRSTGNALDKAVGYGGVVPDRAAADVVAEDRILLCTDGVYESLTFDGIIGILGHSPTAPWAAKNLCDKAASTGTDNATAICVFAKDDRLDGGSARLMC